MPEIKAIKVVTIHIDYYRCNKIKDGTKKMCYKKELFCFKQKFQCDLYMYIFTN